MNHKGPIDLGLGILDHQLVDVDGRRCGKVDDLELEGVTGREPRVAAMVVGARGWRGRGLIGSIAARLAGSTVIVPWEEVASIDSAVHLKKPAGELRLARAEERARAWIERIPGSGL